MSSSMSCQFSSLTTTSSASLPCHRRPPRSRDRHHCYASLRSSQWLRSPHRIQFRFRSRYRSSGVAATDPPAPHALSKHASSMLRRSDLENLLNPTVLHGSCSFGGVRLALSSGAPLRVAETPGANPSRWRRGPTARVGMSGACPGSRCPPSCPALADIHLLSVLGGNPAGEGEEGRQARARRVSHRGFSAGWVYNQGTARGRLSYTGEKEAQTVSLDVIVSA